MSCTTLEGYEENGQSVKKAKKQFDTLDEAIRVAKLENARPERFNKVVAYKCTTCHKYHIGRNGNTISDKEKRKLQEELGLDAKIQKIKDDNRFRNIKQVGWVDLSKIRY